MEPTISLAVDVQFVRYSYRNFVFNNRTRVVVPDDIAAQVENLDDAYLFVGYIPLFNSIACVALTNQSNGLFHGLASLQDMLQMDLSCVCTVTDSTDAITKYLDDETMFGGISKPPIRLLGNGAASVTFMLTTEKDN